MGKGRKRGKGRSGTPAASSNPDGILQKDPDGLVEKDPDAAVEPPAGAAARAQRRAPLLPLVLVFAAQALFILAVFWFADRYALPGWIVALDRVALTGADVAVAVRVERESPLLGLGGISGVEVSFEELTDGGTPRPLGTATTDAKGVAAVGVKAPARTGVLRYRARVAATGGVTLERSEVDVLVSVCDSESRLIVVSLHPTLAERIVAEGEERRPIVARRHASRALEELARSSPVAYLGTLAGDIPARARDWLEENNLPAGPIFFSPLADDGAPDLAPFLPATGLESLAKQSWAICSTEAEARSFATLGFQVIILGGAPAPQGRKFHAARDWREARRIILEDS